MMDPDYLTVWDANIDIDIAHYNKCFVLNSKKASHVTFTGELKAFRVCVRSIHESAIMTRAGNYNACTAFVQPMTN